jgi:hypothetical protein
VRSYPHSEEVHQASQELNDHILRFSTNFESVSARINSRESERARRCYLVGWILSEPQVVSRCASSLESWWLAIDPPSWCGAATTALCGERGDPFLHGERCSLVHMALR